MRSNENLCMYVAPRAVQQIQSYPYANVTGTNFHALNEKYDVSSNFMEFATRSTQLVGHKATTFL